MTRIDIAIDGAIEICVGVFTHQDLHILDTFNQIITMGCAILAIGFFYKPAKRALR